MEYRGPAVETWWILAIGGIVSILFGVAAVFWPGITLMTLVWLFGVYAIAYGLVELANMFRSGDAWWVHLLVGLISLGAGVIVLAWPGITSLVLLYAIAFWAVGVGIAEVLAGLFQAQLGLLVAGVISILFGILLLANPVGGALALIFVIGIFAIVRGILLLVAAIKTPTPTRTAM
jgi:uncharacterized membrane protein HdeD (DUF308 family)